MERLSRDVLNDARRVPRDELREADTYIFDWNPYGWASDAQDLKGRIFVRVTDIGPIAGDIKLEAQDGTVLRDLGEGRRQVMGPADNRTGVPDRTDVGHGGSYYEPPGDMARNTAGMR